MSLVLHFHCYDFWGKVTNPIYTANFTKFLEFQEQCFFTLTLFKVFFSNLFRHLNIQNLTNKSKLIANLGLNFVL